MTELRTDGAVIEALRRVATRKLSARDIHEQRVSFVLASVKDTNAVTRARIEEVLEVQNGKVKG